MPHRKLEAPAHKSFLLFHLQHVDQFVIGKPQDQLSFLPKDAPDSLACVLVHTVGGDDNGDAPHGLGVQIPDSSIYFLLRHLAGVVFELENDVLGAEIPLCHFPEVLVVVPLDLADQVKPEQVAIGLGLLFPEGQVVRKEPHQCLGAKLFIGSGVGFLAALPVFNILLQPSNTILVKNRAKS